MSIVYTKQFFHATWRISKIRHEKTPEAKTTSYTWRPGLVIGESDGIDSGRMMRKPLENGTW